METRPMQRQSTQIATVSCSPPLLSPSWLLAAIRPVAVALFVPVVGAGCPGKPTVPAKVYEGIVVRVACPDEGAGAVGDAAAQGGSVPSGARLGVGTPASP